MNSLYDHLLTCTLKPQATTNLIAGLTKNWEQAFILNNPMALHGPSPTITNPQIAYLLATNKAFAEKFLRPEMQRMFELAIAEAKGSLVSHARTHPMIQKVRQTCTAQVINGDPLAPEGETDEGEDNEDEDNENA
jgi:hypothetical protein